MSTCNLHTVHNAYCKELDFFGSDLPDSIIAIRSFIHDFPAREYEFSLCQDKMKVSKHKLMKHVSLRWLSLEGAARRIIEQLPALKEYFLNHIPAKTAELMKLRKYKFIVEYL